MSADNELEKKAFKHFEEAFRKYIIENPIEDEHKIQQYIEDFVGNEFASDKESHYKPGYFMQQDGALFSSREKISNICKIILEAQKFPDAEKREILKEAIRKQLIGKDGAAEIAGMMVNSDIAKPVQKAYFELHNQKDPFVKKLLSGKEFESILRKGFKIYKLEGNAGFNITNGKSFLRIVKHDSELIVSPSIKNGRVQKESLELVESILSNLDPKSHVSTYSNIEHVNRSLKKIDTNARQTALKRLEPKEKKVSRSNSMGDLRRKASQILSKVLRRSESSITKTEKPPSKRASIFKKRSSKVAPSKSG